VHPTVAAVALVPVRVEAVDVGRRGRADDGAQDLAQRALHDPVVGAVYRGEALLVAEPGRVVDQHAAGVERGGRRPVGAQQVALQLR
jgi:hypothetical protein